MRENSLESQQHDINLHKSQFGDTFQWGVSTSAYQTEGGFCSDGKGRSIWDEFVSKKGKIHLGQTGDEACDFYRRYQEDLRLMKALHIPNFRFSLSWPRLIPAGVGAVNTKGIDYYNRIIDQCLELGIEPWVTLYHWDLPQELEKKGGWTNREIIHWFREYAELCAKHFGDRVKHWMVLNEPMVFVGAGYFMGVHAPGRTGKKNFLSAMHHATICQAAGARAIKQLYPNAEVGTTFSCSHIEPYRPIEKDILAAKRVDALLNRLFIEPALGMGYPVHDLKFLEGVQKWMLPEDDELVKFDFDFIGVQNYTREVIKHSFFTPWLKASNVKAEKRNVPITLMNWEVYPDSIFHMLKKFDAYPGVRKIYVTENGAAFTDHFKGGTVNDAERVAYLKSYINAVLKAKNEGVKVDGYFVWTFTDNFEWAEGYHPRFGLVYIDFKSQKRTVKASGLWYSEFLSGK